MSEGRPRAFAEIGRKDLEKGMADIDSPMTMMEPAALIDEVPELRTLVAKIAPADLATEHAQALWTNPS